jgi:hypothetical protein
VEPFEHLIERLKTSLRGEDLIKAPVKLRFFLRRRGLLVFLQVRIEVPDLGADRLLVLPMLLIERDELVNEAFGMDKAKPVRQDIELTGIVTGDSERLGNAPLAKKTSNYLSMLYLACAIICWRKCEV